MLKGVRVCAWLFKHLNIVANSTFNDPKICEASKYSEIFKVACSNAYSYAYDDATSSYTCRDANYVITFC
ncbi:hypothetical protein LguiA_010665 [Lonicera macranthoides]